MSAFPPAFRKAVLALLVLVGTVAALWVAGRGIPVRELDRFDQPFYLSIAADLYRYGVYGNGVLGGSDGSQPPPPGMFIGPVYPALIYAAMKLDPAFAAAVECMIDHRTAGTVGAQCRPYTSFLVPLHYVFWGGAAALLWLATGSAFRSAIAAWTAVAVTAAAAIINLNLTHWLMTESLSVFLAILHGALLFYAVGRQSAVLAGAAGAALGILALTRPAYGLLFWAYVGAGLLCAFTAGRIHPRLWLKAGSAFLFGYSAPVLPWCLRNLVEVGSFGISHRYGANVLIERLAYNRMSFSEWAASFLYWIPRFGDDMAAKLVGSEALARLDWAAPDSYFHQGGARRTALGLETGGNVDSLLPQLLWNDVVGDAGQHLLVTLSFFWRGLMVYGHMGLILLPLVIMLIVWAGRRKEAALLAFVLPPFLMNGLHAFVAPNQPRYNLALIIGLALAAGWAAARLSRRFRLPADRWA